MSITCEVYVLFIESVVSAAAVAGARVRARARVRVRVRVTCVRYMFCS